MRERTAASLACGCLVEAARDAHLSVAELGAVSQHQRLALARLERVERVADGPRTLALREHVVVCRGHHFEQLAAAPARLEDVRADVARDAAQPRLDAALAAIACHAAM